MPSSYTANLKVEKPASGEQSGTWGDTVNANMDLLDRVLCVCGEDTANHDGLDFYYLAGRLWNGSSLVSIAAGHVSLADDDTNYIEVDPFDGAVSANVDGFTPGRLPLYEVVTASGEIDTVTPAIPVYQFGLANWLDTFQPGAKATRTVTITSGASENDTLNVMLGYLEYGPASFNVPVVAGDAASVAGQLRAASYGGWDVTGSGTVVTFTHSAGGFVNPIYLGIYPSGGSGVTGDWSDVENGSSDAAALVPRTEGNTDVYFGPKGAGVLSAQVPDETYAGGNARGMYATDWQRSREDPAQVASGPYATVGGGVNNEASGGYATVGGGGGNAASGGYATVGGGVNNEASGDYATVGGGHGNIASGEATVVGGGYGNTASGHYSSVQGGKDSVASLRGQSAHAVGRFNAPGDAQRSDLVLRVQTTGGSQVELRIDSGDHLTIRDGQTWRATIDIVARQTGGSAGTVGDSYSVTIYAAIKRIGDTTSLVGSPTQVAELKDSAANWSVAVDADDTNEALRIRVTGETKKTIWWVAHVKLVEVGGGIS